jgi:hypothetical protein
MSWENSKSKLVYRGDMVASLCEDLRQGWDPKERFGIELEEIQNRIHRCADFEELWYWRDLRKKILQLLSGLYEEAAA